MKVVINNFKHGNQCLAQVHNLPYFRYKSNNELLLAVEIIHIARVELASIISIHFNRQKQIPTLK